MSVVIPAYNARSTIRSTIESVLAQTYRPLEVIVVDDGSSDDTVAIVSAMGDPVRCVAQPNQGAATARNNGIERSRGELIAVLDADDLWKPEKLSAQVALMRADPSIGAVQCGSVFTDYDLHPLSVRPAKAGQVTLDDVLSFRGLPALMSTLLVSRPCLAVAGTQDALVEGKDEWEWAMRLARSCHLASIPDALVVHRVFGASMSRNVDSHIRPGLAALAKLFRDPSLPLSVTKRRAYGSFYRMLAGGYFEARSFGPFVRWGVRAVITDPAQLGHLAGLPARRMRRARTR